MPAGHSYGGAVITEAASHEKVAALGKIAAFVPDAGPGIEMRSQSWAPPDKALSAGVDDIGRSYGINASARRHVRTFG